MLERAGLEVTELRPSIDGAALIARRLVRGGKVFERWWDTDSPLNRLLDLYGRRKGLDARSLNAAKLVLCGQFTFVARRPAADEPSARASRSAPAVSVIASARGAAPAGHVREAVDEPVVAANRRRHAGRGEAAAILLALVAQRVEAGGEDESGREAR